MNRGSRITGNFSHGNVYIDGEWFSPTPSQKIYNHSPDGFSWSYAGSGPSQLALALMLEATGDEDEAVRYYQQFKYDVIAILPAKDLDMSAEVVYSWLDKNRRDKLEI